MKTYKAKLFTGFLLFTTISVNAQLSGTVFSQCYGGSASESCVAGQKIENGFILVGSTESSDGQVSFNYGDRDCWVVRVDSLGHFMWDVSIGGSDYDLGSDVIQVHDSGFMVIGITNSVDGDMLNNHGSGDVFVCKIDKNGVKQWVKTYGGSSNDGAGGIERIGSADVIIGGGTVSNDGDISGNHGQSDGFLMRLDSSGNKKWQRCYGGSWSEGFADIKLDNYGNIFFVGGVSSYDGDISCNPVGGDVWMGKTDSSGSLIWNNCYGGSELENYYSFDLTLDGGCISICETTSIDGDVGYNHDTTISGGGITNDLWVAKVDSNGAFQWGRPCGGSNSEEAGGVISLPDSTYLISGTTNSMDYDVIPVPSHLPGGGDAWVAKLDQHGNLLWSQCIGGTGSEWFTSIIDDSPSVYTFLGGTQSVDGDAMAIHGGYDFWVFSLNTTILDINERQKNSINIYPIPANNILTLESQIRVNTVRIINIWGQILLERPANLQTFSIDIDHLDPGIYFIDVKDINGGILQKKFIKL